MTSNGWEPDALTADVRICEGANSIVHGYHIVTPRMGNLWQTGNTNRILHTREFALLTRSAQKRFPCTHSQLFVPGYRARYPRSTHW